VISPVSVLLGHWEIAEFERITGHGTCLNTDAHRDIHPMLVHSCNMELEINSLQILTEHAITSADLCAIFPTAPIKIKHDMPLKWCLAHYIHKIILNHFTRFDSNEWVGERGGMGTFLLHDRLRRDATNCVRATPRHAQIHSSIHAQTTTHSA
jgi:hypothetical protein